MHADTCHRSRTFACLALALALSGCASRAQPAASTQPQVLTLRTGERVALGEQGTLRYVRVANDSRCPPDVQCVWAGDAEVMFEFTPARQEPQPFTLTLLRTTAPLGTRWIHLLGLERGPAPAATLRIDDTPAAPPQ